jgi:hypothetical protein
MISSMYVASKLKSSALREPSKLVPAPAGSSFSLVPVFLGGDGCDLEFLGGDELLGGTS